MSSIQLKAKLRNKEDKNRDRKVFGVIYGPKINNVNLMLEYMDFVRVYSKAGSSTLIDLAVDGKEPIKVLVQDIQMDPVKDQCTHVDFYALDMDKKLKVEVELNFIGEAPAIKVYGGELLTAISKIEVECLPKDLVKEIDIDVSRLENIGDHIYVRDIELPQGLKLVTDGDVLAAAAEEVKEVIEEIPASAEEETEGEEGKESEEGKEEEKKEEGVEEDNRPVA